MAGLLKPARHDGLFKGYPPPIPRASRRNPRRARFISWSLCVFILILFMFWPHKRDQALAKWKQFHSQDVISIPKTRHYTVDTAPIAPILNNKPRLQRLMVEPAEHNYRSDGLLDVNPKGKHPIFELIERAETQWKRKLKRQSKTLTEAVAEYQRRYKRSPPKGFEIWWDYVQFHKVKLVDEYDSIHNRFQPFWGVSPPALLAAQTEWEAKPDTFTIGKLPGATHVMLLNATISGSSIDHERVQDQLALLAEVQEWLPPFRATFTIHDGPLNFVSWELKRRATEAAERGQYIDVARIAANLQSRGWAAACPPSSPIHKYTPPPLPTSHTLTLPPPSLSTPKSFIYNHLLAMSPCLHPTHLTLSGFLSQHHYPYQFGPTPDPALAPTFSMCVSPLHNDILTVAPEQWTDEVGTDPEWEEKSDSRLLWRGSNTGVLHREGNEWNVSQRIRLVEMGTRRGGEMRVLMPRGVGDGDVEAVRVGESEDEDVVPGWEGGVGYGTTIRMSALNSAFMDVAFVGAPMQCQPPVCDVLKGMFEWRSRQTWQDAWQYKYIMDIDGNGWSARFKRLMTSNSLIFKSTIFPEWYTERIMPWVHYIPVQVDLSDLYDILAFFRGDPSGAGAHDTLAARIARGGKTWSETFYRKEDMVAYQFRLFLEYARVMSLDRAAMSYREGDWDVDAHGGMDAGLRMDDYDDDL
ncbi:glycosyltransferase family 90 protein [Ramaria rubella]|nr:glycosyltransferase family 90 protein [Ramaria rubella]